MFSDIDCPVCNKNFESNDDIVVCPICGTPHHRYCYESLNHCFNYNLHDSGWTLNDGIKKKKKEQEKLKQQDFIENLNNYKKDAGGLFCSHCGALNPSDGLFCVICGKKILSDDDKKIGYDIATYDKKVKHSKRILNYNKQINDIPSKEFAAFIGVNIDYFLPKFENLDNKKRSFNFCAFLFPSIYLFYRKMWLWGCILNILNIIFFTSNSIFYIYATKMPPNPFNLNLVYSISLIFGFLLLLFTLFLSLYTNYLYYKKALKTIHFNKPKFKNKKDFYKTLQQKGFVSIKGAIFSTTVLIILLIIGTFLVSS